MNKWIGLTLIVALVLCLIVVFFIFSGRRVGVTYVGILPGADCAGLKTELTLYQDGSYFLRETYLATRDGDKVFTSSGKWQKRASCGRAVIQLNYDKPKELYNFLKKDADYIEVIDKELKEIDTPMNLGLSRKK